MPTVLPTLSFRNGVIFPNFLILQNIFEMAKVGNTENAIHVLATRSRGFFESRLGSTTESPMISLNDP